MTFLPPSALSPTDSLLPGEHLPASSNRTIFLLIYSLLCTGKTSSIWPLWLYLLETHELCPTDVLHSILIILKENLDILIFATSDSASCLLLSPSDGKPDSFIGLNTVVVKHSFLLIVFVCIWPIFFNLSYTASTLIQCFGLLTLSNWNHPASVFVLSLSIFCIPKRLLRLQLL